MTKILGCPDSNNFLFPSSILILHNCICEGLGNDAHSIAQFELKEIRKIQT